MTRVRTIRILMALLLAAGLSLSAPVPAQALDPGSHKNRDAFDVNTPVYVGYDSTSQLYQFRVNGRWRPVCGSSQYCWPTSQFTGSGSDYNIGSNDAAIIRFSDAVQIKKMQIRTWDVCGTSYYDKKSSVNPGSFENAYAGVNDEKFAGYTKTVSGGTTSEGGPCKSSTEPLSGMAAGGGGGSATITWWNDLKARYWSFDVWVNPAPSQGNCYDQLYVKGGYTHTWTDAGMTWGLGYPWGVGVGYQEVDGSLTVFQGNDGFSDPDLKTGRLCRH
jgi:hypothetical protein